MHFFLYEFITGGGWLFVEPNERPHGSLLREGLAMISAIAEDFAALPGVRITILWDARLALPPLFEQMSNFGVVLIHSTGEHDDQLAKHAANADTTLLIAPEFDGHLLRVCQLAENSGGRLLSPSRGFIELASDKHTTAEYLAQRGIAVPKGIVIAPGEQMPSDFPYPAVLKPLDGAGSQDVRLISQASNEIASRSPMRLEQLHVGQAVSVAALCGPAGHLLLPPCTQRLSDDGTFSYLGGATPLPVPLAIRATALANQTFAALPPALGYIGIDMVLANDRCPDVVIEVNPRLTTSYVGLRRLVRENLAAALLQTADGRPPVLSLRPGRVEFTADGEAMYSDNCER
jgi:predicted ATP-grasp superfamily ATP-dependent carboligase